MVVFLLITTGFSTKVRRVEARNVISLNSHIAKCWFHEGQVGKCTNITLATAFVMETKKCYDCYWYTQKAHYPNVQGDIPKSCTNRGIEQELAHVHF